MQAARQSARAGPLRHAMQLAGLEQRFLALTDEDGIEEGRVRLGVVHRGTAGNDDGVVFASVSRQQWNASEVECLEEVRHRHLVRHMQTDDIKRSDRREQRNARLAHSVTHIGPRHIATLAGDALGLVKDVVEDGDTLVGQTDLVHIRIDQAATVVGIGLGKRAPLVIDIATRLLDLGEQRLN